MYTPNSALSDVGHHFFVGLRPGLVLDPRDRALLEDVRPAGVIFYKSNFAHGRPYPEWLESHRRMVEEVREACGRDRLFIAIDHEGGRVCRTPPPITRYSYACRWSATADAVGTAMGRELASLAFNVNFAPVLDIHSNPDNPVIGERAFGSTPEDVTDAAVAFMRAMEANGVRACGKHFPGHGDTSVDSHRELPVLPLSSDTIRDRELVPFRAAIEGGIGMIMTSHIVFPELDADRPATLSRRITQDLLRGELGFDGVIVSDDIGMHAMDGFLDQPEAIIDFLKAGNDMLMIASHFTDTDRARGFARAIEAAVLDGRLSAAAVGASRERVEEMLASTAQHEVTMLSGAAFAEHAMAGALFQAETVEVV